ncbi:ATP-dependent RNA helicase, partial [Coemansia sp. RSA 551]
LSVAGHDQQFSQTQVGDSGPSDLNKEVTESSEYAQYKTEHSTVQNTGSLSAEDGDLALKSVNERSLEAGQGGKTNASGSLAKCLIVVPCFRESIETLTRTLQGIARSAHADSHKMLWIINDGDPDVLNSIVRILAHSGHISDPKFYGAYSVDSSSYGSARVYAGYYECGRHRIPYVVSAKETYQGSVDSLMMVLNFFRSLSSSPRQSDMFDVTGSAYSHTAPQTIFLEEEVEARMALLGHPPTAIDYCLLLDGSVQIDPLAITQFVARMESNPEIVALSGTLYPVGRPSSLIQILQTFEFYLQHFVSPICESLSNVTCPLNQLFTMYRVRLDSGDRCLGDDELVASMDALMKSSVRYRHRTWPGNDCLLVPRMVRQFPQHRWSFEPNGRAEVELTAHVMAAFDPYERQWFRTRLVTLFDILRGRMLKRTLPIMLGHLIFPFIVPAASCMLYLEI